MKDLSLSDEDALQPGLSGFVSRNAAFAEPIMVVGALMAVVLHPVFYLIWKHIYPQPYESLWLRLLASAIAAPVLFKDYWPRSLKKLLPVYWTFGVWFCIPFMFTLFLVLNNFNQLWVLTVIAGILLITFITHVVMALLMFVSAAIMAFGLAGFIIDPQVITAPVDEILIVYLFTLAVGGAFNQRLQAYHSAQMAFAKHLRALSGQNAMMMREHNHLLARFLNNVIVNRLQKYQARHGLETALDMITRQEKRYCAILQADVRNFTKRFGIDTEFQVAQLISQCFAQVTETGQDLAVIKPIGDSIFVYCDDENGREDAVLNILALASLLVHTVDRINAQLEGTGTPLLNFGIAVHSGDVIYGNLASHTMIDPTVIGMNVNMTARMEELTKSPVIQKLVGTNAVILSEEFYWIVRKSHREFSGVMELRLDELGVAVRDFPRTTRVYALPREAALAFYPIARDRLNSSRAAQAPQFRTVDHSRLLGVEYYVEMYGSGPNTSWCMFFNVSMFSQSDVDRVVSEHFSHLQASASAGEERWLTLSTEDEPGEYDENIIDAWVYEFIGLLSGQTSVAVDGDESKSRLS